MKFLKIVPIAFLFICCDKSKSEKQNSVNKIIQPINSDLARKEFLEREFINPDSVKINGFEAFGVSKAYLEKSFGRPDSIKRDDGDICISESIYWGRSNYSLCWDGSIQDLNKALKTNSKSYFIGTINFDEGYLVKMNHLIIDQNTTFEEIRKVFPKNTDAPENRSFRFHLKAGDLFYDSWIIINFKNDKASTFEYYEDNS
jgi:hypothetical protein